MNENKPTPSRIRNPFNRHRLRRRFQKDPVKTIQWLIENKATLPEKLYKKLERYLHKHPDLNPTDVAAITEVLDSDSGDENSNDSEFQGGEDVSADSPAKSEE